MSAQIAIMASFLGIAWFIAWSAFNFRENHEQVSIFMYVLSLGFLIGAVSTANVMVENDSALSYMNSSSTEWMLVVLLWSTVLLSGYLILGALGAQIMRIPAVNRLFRKKRRFLGW